MLDVEAVVLGRMEKNMDAGSRLLEEKQRKLAQLESALIDDTVNFS